MRSEFEKLLKQHKDALTDELVKLGKHRQAQLVKWDIEQNETDYEFYFDGAWNAQQSKVDELQKRVDAALNAINEHYESDGMSGLMFIDLREILLGEQALKGGSDE